MVTSAGAIEHDRIDALGLRGFRGEFAGALRPRDIRFHVVAIDRFARRASRCNRHALGVVDELNVNVLVGKTHRHARTLRGALHLFPNAPLAQLPQPLFLFDSHVFAPTDFAVGILILSKFYRSNSQLDYWTVFPSFRLTCSSEYRT